MKICSQLSNGRTSGELTLLEGRLKIDDPDNFGDNYVAEKRLHGTAMASIILNGDLDNPNESKLTRPIYVRPIMKPDINSFSQGEFLPNDKLAIDLVHNAIKRMFEGGSNPPAGGHANR